MASQDDKKRFHRVDSDELPSIKKAKSELLDNLTDIGYWVGEKQNDERVLLAEWPGQDPSGRMWDRYYNRQVAPWDGCADTVVRLADAASDELVMLMVMAFITANPSAVQQNAYAAEKAGKVQTLLKYEMRQRMAANLWEEMNFGTNWMVDYGQTCWQVGWKREFVTGKGEISAEELAAWAAQAVQEQQGDNDQGGETDQDAAPSPMIVEEMTQQIQALLDDPARLDQLVALMQAKYPMLSPKRAKKLARDLAKEGGSVEFRLPIEQPGRPFIKAYCPGIDIFKPWRCWKTEESPWVATVEQLTEPQVWAKINTDGWDEDFCRALIERGPMKAVEQGSMDPMGVPYNVGRPIFDSGMNNSAGRRNRDMHSYFEVIRMVVTAIDEDFFPATFELIFHPALGEKDRESMYAVNRLVDDYVSEFVDCRREYKTRSPFESRGVPQLMRQPQIERKWMRDGRLNRNDMATNPPIRTTRRNAAGKPERLGMAPGRVMMEERGQESGFVAPPQFDEGSVEEEELIMMDAANLLGLFHEKVLPAKTAMHQQWLVNNFLGSCREIAMKIIQADQRYMEPVKVSRVVGNGDAPFSVDREEIEGQFDVQFEYDVRMSDPDYVESTWKVITEAMQADRNGELNTSVLIRWLIQSKSPTLADMACGDPQQALLKEQDDERAAIGQAVLGVIQTPKPGGNAQARLDVLHQELNTNPTVQQAYQTNQRTFDILNARAKTWMLALQQNQNASIGATGWNPPAFAGQGPQASPAASQPAQMPQS